MLKTCLKKDECEPPSSYCGRYSYSSEGSVSLKIRKPIISVSQPEEVAKASRRGIVVQESGVVFSEKERPCKNSQKQAKRKSIGWVKAAVEWCLAKRASAVVTAPL